MPPPEPLPEPVPAPLPEPVPEPLPVDPPLPDAPLPVVPRLVRVAPLDFVAAPDPVVSELPRFAVACFELRKEARAAVRCSDTPPLAFVPRRRI